MSITTLNVLDKAQRYVDTEELAKTSRESYYYWQRERYNELSKEHKKKKDISLSTCDPELAALMIFLNKTCFRGLYREGPNGFNVPYGNYKNPQIFYSNHIERLNKILTNVTFAVDDFQQVIAEAKPGDFVYMDPPYVPEKQTSFTAYLKDGFKHHSVLFDLCSDLNNAGINFLMSNSNTPLVTDYFTKDNYTVDKIDCRRAINSKNPKARAKEVFITNL
jgi:DNA adenine methylase